MKWIDAKRGESQGNSERAARIDHDIDEELAFHLARLEDELREEGVAESAIKEQARRRFGDQMRLHEECKAIALKELNMLKKIHLSVTILLVIAVLGAGLFAWQAMRATAMARQQAMVQTEVARHASEQAHTAQEHAMVQTEIARHERERAHAVTQFLTAVLTQTDPETPHMVDVATLLREAEARLGVTFEDNPEIETKLREAIEAAKRSTEH